MNIKTATATLLATVVLAGALTGCSSREEREAKDLARAQAYFDEGVISASRSVRKLAD